MNATDWIFTALLGLIVLIVIAAALVSWWDERQQQKRRRIERELDEAQQQLRATILQLATELNADAHDTRKAMIRESFLAGQRAQNGPTPPAR